jgi:hypothetical protein
MPQSESDLVSEIVEVTLTVHSAEDRKDDREVVTRAHMAVERLAENYRQFCASLSESDRMRIEGKLGRKVSDVRRLAALLPRIGAVGPSTPDRRVDGPSLPQERKITGVSWRVPAAASLHEKVGGDVEAWCGPCAGMTTHSVIAMVDNQPKKVACQACNNHHNYRTTPARTESRSPTADSRERRADDEARRKNDEANARRNTLIEEVMVATAKAFDPKERYRVGDVIDHPQFGRGKVETVLRQSLLVRFARGGLKSLMLV